MAVSAFTQLGSTFSSNTSTQTSLSFASLVFPTTGTDILGIVLVAVSGTNTGQTFTVSDNLGNTWTQVEKREDGVGTSGCHIVMAYFKYPSAGGSTTATVTVSWTANVNERMAVAGYCSGHDTTTSIDSSGGVVGIGTTTTVTPSTAASVSNGGLGLYIWHGPGGTAPGGHPPTGWTGIANPQDATRARSAAFGYQQISSAGVLSAGAFTNTASSVTPPVANIVVVRAAGSGAPVNTVAPAITGTVALGNTLTSDNGTWSGSPTSYTYQWQRSSNSGSTWVNIPNYTSQGTPTAATHTVVGFDVGSVLRCVVTATNANGSTPANSNTTSEVAAPSTPSFRMVALPVTQSDNQSHAIALTGAILANETIVLVASTSVPTISGGMGSVTDASSNSYTRDHESGVQGSSGHITQAYSAQNGGTKMQIGALISNAVKQTTVVGAHAVDSPTINVVSTSGFETTSPGGVIIIGVGGPSISYTGITSTSFTGVGSHIALSGGETILYHGQSPYYTVYALNPGDGSGSRCVFDAATASHGSGATNAGSAGTIVSTKQSGIAFTLVLGGSGDVNNWLTGGTGWTVDFAGYLANHLTGGAADAFGISYAGESAYKIAVQTKTYSAVSTSITGDYTGDTGVGGYQDAMVIAYGFTPTSGVPANTVAPSSSGTPQQGFALSTTNGTWTNSPTSYSYQWQQDASGNSVYSNIAGATSSSFTLTATQVGCNVRCQVTATNASGSGTPANSNVQGLVIGPDPVCTVLPVISGTQQQTFTLSTTNGTWDIAISSYVYSWQRDTAGNGVYGAIPGANASTYTLVAADVGCHVRVIVLANAVGGGGSSVASNPTGLIAGPPTAPVNTVAPNVTGIPYQAYTLSCDTGTWTQSPTGYTYQWQRDVAGNGVFSNIAAATSSTYVLAAADLTNKVRCVVTATNPIGNTSANSNQLGPVTTAPASTAKVYGVGAPAAVHAAGEM